MKSILVLGMTITSLAFSQAQNKRSGKPDANEKTKRYAASMTTKGILRAPQSAEGYLKKCLKEFTAAATKYGSLDRWIEQAPAQSNGKAFRTPTQNFGRWLEANLDSSGHPVLFEIGNNQTTKISFRKDCSTEVSIVNGMDFSKLNPDSHATWFDDKALKKLLNTQASGIIYVWSPEMLYSARHYKWFESTARRMKIKFIPLIDPRTSMKLVDSASKEFGIPYSKLKLNAVELYMRGVTIHYPTTLVFKNGMLSDFPLVGVMGKEEIEERVLSRMSDLNY